MTKLTDTFPDSPFYFYWGDYTSFLCKNVDGKCDVLLGYSTFWDGKPIEDFVHQFKLSGVGNYNGMLLAFDKLPNPMPETVAGMLEAVVGV